MQTPKHTPAGRGFQHSLIYFHHCNSYWTSTVGSRTDKLCSPDGAMIDLWTNTGPAPQHTPGVYQENMFVDKAKEFISTYSTNTTAKEQGPLFLYYASHAVHTPMEVPQRNLDKFLGVTELTLPGQGYLLRGRDIHMYTCVYICISIPIHMCIYIPRIYIYSGEYIYICVYTGKITPNSEG